MPTLDMSAVLTAQEFLDAITIKSVYSLINGNGETVALAPVSTSGRAVVVPGRSNMRRESDGTRVAAYIDVYTRARLSAGGTISDTQERFADVIVWHGNTYVVASVEDFSAFGTGFVHASCDLQQVNLAAYNPVDFGSDGNTDFSTPGSVPTF